MSLENYIETLRSDGSLDSAGTFTLNQAQALQKLRRHQISNPAEFSAGLVASAIASGADWITLSTPTGGFRLEHNGASIPHTHLLGLFSSLLVAGPDPSMAAVQELAYGLNALLSLSPKTVRVTCSCPDELAVLELSPQQLVVRRAEPYETYGTARRTLVEVSGLWKGVNQLLRWGLGQRPELEVLRQRCRFASASILCNGEPLQCPQEFPQAVCTARIGSPPSLPLAWPTSMLDKDSEVSAWVGLCPDSPSQLTIVMHGVSFVVAEESLPTGIQAVVYSSQLRKDLSHAAIVQDEAYAKCIEQVGSLSSELLDALSTQWRRVPREQRARTSYVLEVEARRCRELWKGERADLLSAAARALRN